MLATAARVEKRSQSEQMGKRLAPKEPYQVQSLR